MKTSEMDVLTSVVKVQAVITILVETLEDNKVTFEEAIAILAGIENSFAQAIRKDPSKRTTLVKKVD